MNLYLNIYKILAACAEQERITEPRRLSIARESYPTTVVPCEACGKNPVTPGGLCPSCLMIAATACKILGR